MLSNSMDQTIFKWDIRPFCPTATDNNEGTEAASATIGGGRCMAVLSGATHNFEKNLLRVRWGMNDKLCGAGSADRYVYVWNLAEKPPKLSYKLPGHTGSVNEVCFHPTEPIVASCSSDRKVYLGELS
eukprot:GHVN01057068.1.p1 GENE.GHVN01057068.1~~GHVN01057068.1.p1  ORF type:complete len:128 (-),score=12.70 GHVN01057068.1:363-746(-)